MRDGWADWVSGRTSQLLRTARALLAGGPPKYEPPYRGPPFAFDVGPRLRV
jgi:hypothetical protein